MKGQGGTREERSQGSNTVAAAIVYILQRNSGHLRIPTLTTGGKAVPAQQGQAELAGKEKNCKNTSEKHKKSIERTKGKKQELVLPFLESLNEEEPRGVFAVKQKLKHVKTNDVLAKVTKLLEGIMSSLKQTTAANEKS